MLGSVATMWWLVLGPRGRPAASSDRDRLLDVLLLTCPAPDTIAEVHASFFGAQADLGGLLTLLHPLPSASPTRFEASFPTEPVHVESQTALHHHSALASRTARSEAAHR